MKEDISSIKPDVEKQLVDHLNEVDERHRGHAFETFMDNTNPSARSELFKEAVARGMGWFCFYYLAQYGNNMDEAELIRGFKAVIREPAITSSDLNFAQLISSISTATFNAITDDLLEYKRFDFIEDALDSILIAPEAREAFAHRLTHSPEGAQALLRSRFAMSMHDKGLDLAKAFDTASLPVENEWQHRTQHLLDIAAAYGEGGYFVKERSPISFSHESVMRCVKRYVQTWDGTSETTASMLRFRTLFETSLNLNDHDVHLADVLSLCQSSDDAIHGLFYAIDRSNPVWKEDTWKEVPDELARSIVMHAIDRGYFKMEALPIFESKSISSREILERWANTRYAGELLSEAVEDERYKPALSPELIEQCVRSACRAIYEEKKHEKGPSGLMLVSAFEFAAKHISAPRVVDIFLSENLPELLIHYVAGLRRSALPFDLTDAQIILAWEKMRLTDEFYVTELELLDAYPRVHMPETFYAHAYENQVSFIAAGGGIQQTNMAHLLKSHDALPAPRSQILTRLTAAFGVNCPEMYFKYCTKDIQIFENDPRHASVVESRIQELRRERLFVLSTLLKGDITEGYLKENPIRVELLLDAVRFGRSQFGGHSSEEFLKLVRAVEKYQSSDAKGALDPLPPEFASGTITVALKGEDKSVEFDEGFSAKYTQLILDLRKARFFYKTDPMRDLVLNTQDFAKEMQTAIQATYEEQKKLGNEKALPRLEKALTDLDSFEWKRPSMLKKRVGDLIALAAEFAKREQESRARQLLIRLAIYQGRQLWDPEEMYTSFNNPMPNEKGISQLEDSLNHVTYKETWLPFVKDEKRYVKALRKLLPTKFLSEKLAEFEGTTSGKSMELNVYPARGMALETSGHMGDACWASKYDCINSQFPNILSLVFTRKAKTGEEIIGSSLLIETVTQAGNKALIIRGLNPLQKIMGGEAGGDVDEGSLLPEAFMTELKKYLQPIADARGADLGIVIDDHSGGSGTNRPILYSYLHNKLRPTLEPMVPLSNDDTKFNGYSIKNCTYYL